MVYLGCYQDKCSPMTQFSTTLDVRIRWNSASRSPTQQRPHQCHYSLVFMGSEKYPYKGIIDHFANRGFSNGTNAWTDDDHTAYTASTAGAQGFLQLLPIYVDHILYPTLTKSGCVPSPCAY